MGYYPNMIAKCKSALVLRCCSRKLERQRILSKRAKFGLAQDMVAMAIANDTSMNEHLLKVSATRTEQIPFSKFWKISGKGARHPPPCCTSEG